MRQEILEIPRALRMMWAKGRPPYDALVRRAAWSEKPIFIIGSGSSYLAALTGAYAFDSLLKLPAVVRTPEVFSAYSISALAFRSLLIAISPSGECEKTLEAAQEAKNRGATVWGLTANPASRLGALADGIAPLYLHEAPADGMQSALCQHAAMISLALAAARVLKRPAVLLDAQESDLEKLPENIERVHNQFTDAARALAGELQSLSKVVLTGGGLYHPAALQAAHHFHRLAGLPAAGFELVQFRDGELPLIEKDAGVVMLSGSRCALKAEVHRVGESVGKKAGGKLFAITDSNDQQLSHSAAMSVLLPALMEPGGALLALAFLDCVAHYAAGHSAESTRRARRLATS
jgi:fructoselysine-6-P-deglycase FrlB-like protein